jgi:hypothetical protein
LVKRQMAATVHQVLESDHLVTGNFHTFVVVEPPLAGAGGLHFAGLI